MIKKYVEDFRRSLFNDWIEDCDTWPKGVYKKTLESWYSLDVDYKKSICDQFLVGKDYYIKLLKDYDSTYRKCKELYLYELPSDSGGNLVSNIKYSEAILERIKQNIFFVLRGISLEMPGILETWFDKDFAQSIRSERKNMNLKDRSYHKTSWENELDDINRYTRGKLVENFGTVLVGGGKYKSDRKLFTREDKSYFTLRQDDFIVGWYEELLKIKPEKLNLEQFKNSCIIQKPVTGADYFGVLWWANKNSGNKLFPDGLVYDEKTTTIQSGESAMDAYFNHLDDIKAYVLGEYTRLTPPWYTKVVFTTLWQK